MCSSKGTTFALDGMQLCAGCKKTLRASDRSGPRGTAGAKSGGGQPVVSSAADRSRRMMAAKAAREAARKR